MYRNKKFSTSVIPNNFTISKIKNEKIERNRYIAAIKKLENIHKKLTLKYGTFQDEYPEQIMACNFLKAEDIVLEIGANIGRNTLVISEILNNDQNLVTMECNPSISLQLLENRDINGKKFTIISKALSKTPLLQDGWTCFSYSDIDKIDNINNIDKYTKIDNISFKEIEEQTNKKFTALVVDCEGSFYHILKDFPEILENISTIIMENDYHNYDHKKEVDAILLSKNFKRIYHSDGGWGPCKSFFFETWTK